MKKIILFLLLVFICSFKSEAQLYFKNHEVRPVSVALSYYHKDANFEGYISKGWYTIEPGETKMLIAGDLQYANYYYYAHDGAGVTWQGQGKYQFVVDRSNAFDIKNANMAYQKDGHSSREFKNFKKVDVGQATTYTLTLTLSAEE